MNTALAFNITSIIFDENYHPSNSTRLTTNFANLARGESRQENLRNTLNMINNRFNALAHWDNPKLIVTQSSLKSSLLKWILPAKKNLSLLLKF